MQEQDSRVLVRHVAVDGDSVNSCLAQALEHGLPDEGSTRRRTHDAIR